MNKDLEFLTRVIDEKSAKILDPTIRSGSMPSWRSMRQIGCPVKINLKEEGLP